MTPTLVLLFVSAAAIYASCEFFVNGVEWAGQRFSISRNAVGTVLAAFGTALPESVITFVAVVFGDNDAQREIGVGAALGGPLVLATVAYAAVGFVFLKTRNKQSGALLVNVDTRKLSHDQRWFVAIFIVKVLAGLVAFALKAWLGVAFLAAYGVYIWTELRGDGTGDVHPELEPLKLRPASPRPGTTWVLVQTVGALVVIFASSRVFVHQLDVIGPLLGIRPQLVALLLSPIATELPEIMNAVIWVRQGKVSLALGNISGAMMIQATVPSALGLFFTPWMLETPLIWAAIVTLVAIIGLDMLLRRHALTPGRLALFGWFYVVFAIGILLLGR